jgi:hypothetical protein
MNYMKPLCTIYGALLELVGYFFMRLKVWGSYTYLRVGLTDVKIYGRI